MRGILVQEETPATKNKRCSILIAAGGTGGHLYPAESLAFELKSKLKCDISFAGCGLEKNPFLSKSFPWFNLPLFPSKNPLFSFFKKGFSMFQATWKALKILEKERPQLVVGFGSYHALPVLAAAFIKKIPFVLHEANAFPGRVTRLMSPFAEFTGTHFSEISSILKGPVVPATLPIRPSFFLCGLKQPEARTHLNLKPNLPTLLFLGGSQGAQAINHAVPSILKSLRALGLSFQFIHLTGNNEETEKSKKLAQKLEIPSYIKTHETHMEVLWRSTDLAISRAGASSINEGVFFSTPQILIPYPLATNKHQDKNAAFMTKRIGGAITVNQSKKMADEIIFYIRHMLKDEAKLLGAMRQALKLYHKRLQENNFSHTIIKWIETH